MYVTRPTPGTYLPDKSPFELRSLSYICDYVGAGIYAILTKGYTTVYLLS